LSQFSRLVRIARTDFSYFFRTKWLMAVLISLSLSDMLVVGLVYTRLIPASKAIGSSYFEFLVRRNRRSRPVFCRKQTPADESGSRFEKE